MIEVSDVTRSYGPFRAVDAVSFRVEKGEIVGLLGHNGAGKTTIMKMMTGFLEPDSGRLSMHNWDLSLHRQQAQALIGYLPENCPLYPEMTVVDYLDYCAGLQGMVTADVAAAVQRALQLTELMPRAQQRIDTLSRGYRQRVGVARAILHQPRVLILDEPTNGLDPNQIQHMRTLIKRLSAQATIILSTHILQEVEAICDRVLIIRNGSLALDQKLSDLHRSQRLWVETDASAAVFAGEHTVKDLSEDGASGRYRLSLAADQSPTEVAAEIAARITQAGHRLFALYPEQHDLEAVFRRINQDATHKEAA